MASQNEENLSLFVVVALNLPTEIFNTSQLSWSRDILTKLTLELEVPGSYIDAYLPFTSVSTFESMNIKERIDQTEPFLSQMSRHTKLKLHINLLMFLVVNGFYDARGRVLMRNIRNSLCLTSQQFVSVEVQLAKSLMDSQKRSLNRPEDNKGKNSRYFRYAKIGAAAVGAGAVLALTGGLAAPAVAAAFVVMGGTTAAAAAVSVTTMAAVFGSAGAGLTGYKMLRRTRGLQEFEFEQHDRKVGEHGIVDRLMLNLKFIAG
jgi:hypothetical protein